MDVLVILTFSVGSALMVEGSRLDAAEGPEQVSNGTGQAACPNLLTNDTRIEPTC